VKNKSNPKNRAQVSDEQFVVAPIGRYIAAILYDSLLLLAVLFIASLLYMIPYMLNADIDSSQTKNLSNTAFQTPVFKTYIFLVWFLFFAWFWTHGGQTLGLRVWKLRVQTIDGQAISLMQALLRFLTALAPWAMALFLTFVLKKAEVLPEQYTYWVILLGFSGIAWAFIDKDRITAHDRFSETRVVKLTSELNSTNN